MRELNEIYDKYKAELKAAAKTHKKKPETPGLGDEIKNLMKLDIIKLNSDHNRYDLDVQKAFKHAQSAGVWILASSQDLTPEEIFFRYRTRNNIEIMYRCLKNRINCDTLKIENEQSFNAKLFIGMLTAEFRSILNLRRKKYNEGRTKKDRAEFKQNSVTQTLNELASLEAIIDGDKVIPTSNLLKRHEALFAMMDIEPVMLQNPRLKNLSLGADIDINI